MHLESSIVVEDTVTNVFKRATDIHNTHWRSDLKIVKGIDDSNFIEYSKKNYPTFCTILKSTKNKVYALEFTNNKVEGNISYTFKKEENKTSVAVVADVTFVDAKFKVIEKQKLKRKWKKFIEDFCNIEQEKNN